MPIDVMAHPATNPEKAGGGLSAAAPASWQSKLGDYLYDTAMVVPIAIATGGKAVAKGTWDTFTAKHNNVPYSIRAAVAGSHTAADKLATLRQYYPDAMPNGDKNFTFVDPSTKERVLLDDLGISMGDMVESIPEWGRAIGGTLGGLGGAVAGSAGGPGGTVGGGAIGAGVGGVWGQHQGEEISRDIAHFGSLGKNPPPINTQSFGDRVIDDAWTFAADAAGGALPLGYYALKNLAIGKLLTKDSPKIAASMRSQGYKPTLSAIGSPYGKKIDEKLVNAGISKRHVFNQERLNTQIDDYVGPALAKAEKDLPTKQNTLANTFREKQQAQDALKHDTATDLYAKFALDEDFTPEATQLKQAYNQVKTRGGFYKTPDGKYVAKRQGDKNPYYKLDPDIELALNQVAHGKANELTLDALSKDMKKELAPGNKLKYQQILNYNALIEATEESLIHGRPGLGEARKEASDAYRVFMADKADVRNILNKTAGVTDKSAVGLSKTEGENLANARGVFSSGAHGSDSEAAKIANVLSQPEKDIVQASILEESRRAPAETLSKYNAERMGAHLVDPGKKEAFNDLMTIAPQVRGMHAPPIEGIAQPDHLQRSWYNPMAIPQRILNQPRASMALKAASKGETPESLAAKIPSIPQMATGVIGEQRTFGYSPNTSTDNITIPQKQIDEALPEDMKGKGAYASQPLNVDDILNKVTGAAVDPSTGTANAPDELDDLISNVTGFNPGPPPSPVAGSTPIAPPVTPPVTPPMEGSPTGVAPSSAQPGGVNAPLSAGAYGNATSPPSIPLKAITTDDLDAYAAQNYAKKVTTSDLDDYAAKNYRQKPPNQSGYGGEVPASQQAREKLSQKMAGKDVFKASLEKNLDLLEKSGITGERLNHFVAQLAHETGGFNHMNEIDPSKSNLSDKGGETYKGRGWIQLTGDRNYKHYGDELGLDLLNNPDLAADPDNAMRIAVAYWNDNNLNKYADNDDIVGLTKRIQGPGADRGSINSRASWLNKIRSGDFKL